MNQSTSTGPLIYRWYLMDRYEDRPIKHNIMTIWILAFIPVHVLDAHILSNALNLYTQRHVWINRVN